MVIKGERDVVNVDGGWRAVWRRRSFHWFAVILPATARFARVAAANRAAGVSSNCP